jgi:hypothetical protein
MRGFGVFQKPRTTDCRVASGPIWDPETRAHSPSVAPTPWFFELGMGIQRTGPGHGPKSHWIWDLVISSRRATLGSLDRSDSQLGPQVGPYVLARTCTPTIEKTLQAGDLGKLSTTLHCSRRHDMEGVGGSSPSTPTSFASLTHRVSASPKRRRAKRSAFCAPVGSRPTSFASLTYRVSASPKRRRARCSAFCALLAAGPRRSFGS